MSNYNKSNQDKPQANTNGSQYYGKYDETTLAISYWNNYLTLRIHPALSEDKRSANSKFDYGNEVRANISSTDALKLYRALDKAHIEDLVDEGSFDKIPSIGISIANGTGFVEVASGHKFGMKDPNTVCLRIYGSVDSSCKTDVYLTYTFESSDIFNDYNNITGKFTSKSMCASFTEFMNTLYDFSKSMNKAIAHSINDANKYDKRKDLSNLSQIAEKLGVSFGSKTGGSRGYTNTNGFNSSGTSNYATSDDPISNDIPTERFNIDEDSELPF